jgi:hypothetical protein
VANEELALVSGGVAAAAYVAQKLFGKTLEEMGNDLNKVYQSNRDKLLAKAVKKVSDPNDGATPNLRVARDVIWNGAVTDDEVCAEYFGGLLAASRSMDGRDDSALIFVDCIKALSSKQLHLHFVIYSCLQALLLKSGKSINPGVDQEINALEIWFASTELHGLGLRPSIDLNILHRQGLVSAYEMNHRVDGEKSLPYVKAKPTTFGVLLYAAALNHVSQWTSFSTVAFSRDPAIALPTVFAATLDELSVLCGLILKADSQNSDAVDTSPF